MKFSETLNEVIRLASAARTYWDRELPKRHPRYPIITADAEDPPPPPEEQELDVLLRSLPPDQVYALLLLTQIVWGVGIDHLDERYQALKQDFPHPDLAVEELTGKVALDDDLLWALDELKQHGLDVDQLGLAGAPARP